MEVAGSGATVCTACPAGTFANQAQSSFCSGCSGGTYQSSSSQTYCSKCAAGTYSDSTVEVAGSGATVCTSCPAGTFANQSQSSFCSGCSGGTYQSSSSQTYCTHCSVCVGLTYEIKNCSAWSDMVCGPIESSLPIQVKMILLAFPFLVLFILPLFFRIVPDAVVPDEIDVLQPLRKVDLPQVWVQLKSSSLLEIDANESIRVALWTMVATSCDHLSNLFLVLLLSPTAPYNIFWVAAVSFCGSQVTYAVQAEQPSPTCLA